MTDAEFANVLDPGLVEDMVTFRRDIHSHPELGFHEHRTSSRIADALRNMGLEVHEGIGGTGIVARLKIGNSPRTIGLRADMDALPIQEQTNLPHASQTPGVFHGCGHDGHVAMLLGAARHLSRTRNFDGTVHFIFQPAEEGLGGARRMIADGLFDRFPCDRIFALHNWPELPLGTIAVRPGPMMAASDKFDITLKCQGGHAAMPYKTSDAILAASQLVGQLNTIVARRIPASASAVLSVTAIEGGKTHNVIPASVRVAGTVRTFDSAIQDRIEEALRQVAAGVALAHDVEATIVYDRYHAATINDAEAAAEALAAAQSIGNAILAPEPSSGSEDFAYMLQACKGAYIWLGQGREGGSPSLHHPAYDFNDDAMAKGIQLHIALAEAHLAP